MSRAALQDFADQSGWDLEVTPLNGQVHVLLTAPTGGSFVSDAAAEDRACEAVLATVKAMLPEYVSR